MANQRDEATRVPPGRRASAEPIEEEPETPEAAFGRESIPPPAPASADRADNAEEERVKEEAAATDPA